MPRTAPARVIVKPGERLLSPVEATEYLGISPRTLARLTSSGDLRAVKVGAQLRYPEGAIADYLNRHGVGSA